MLAHSDTAILNLEVSSIGRGFICKCEFSGYYMKIQGMFLFEKIYDTLLCQLPVTWPRQEKKGGWNRDRKTAMWGRK